MTAPLWHDTVAHERDTVGLRKMRLELAASIAELDTFADDFEGHARIRHKLADDLDANGVNPVFGEALRRIA